MKTLLHAHAQKRISVYVTEARPRGLGLVPRPKKWKLVFDISRSIKTYEALTAAGIPCTVVLDSAVAYVMDTVDFVLVGSEAVVESGGLINAVGSHQMAIIAKAANKPFYALAERLDYNHHFSILFTIFSSVISSIDYSPCHSLIYPPTTPAYFHFHGPEPLLPWTDCRHRLQAHNSSTRGLPSRASHTPSHHCHCQ